MPSGARRMLTDAMLFRSYPMPMLPIPILGKSCRFRFTADAENNDLIEVADALGDMLYILCGTILSHGMQHKITEVFNEIQRSNMSKLGSDGKPIYREDGKVLKGPNYFKPNIASILHKD